MADTVNEGLGATSGNPRQIEQDPVRAWRYALEAWNVVLHRAPDNAKAQRWQARCLERLSAIEQTGALARVPAGPADGLDALIRGARTLSKQCHDCGSALKVWAQVLIEQPDHAAAHRARCYCLMQAGHWTELVAAVEAGLPYLDSGALLRLARQATDQEQWSAALHLWRLSNGRSYPFGHVRILKSGHCAFSPGGRGQPVTTGWPLPTQWGYGV